MGYAWVCLRVDDDQYLSRGEILRQRAGIQRESPRILETKIKFQFVALIYQQESKLMLMDLTLEIQYPIIIFALSRKFDNRSRLLASYPLGVPFESKHAFPLLRYTAGLEPVAAVGQGLS